MMEEKWMVFVRLHRDEMAGVIHTPLYNLMAENFPIQFITKLISTVVKCPDYKASVSAAVMIRDVAESRHFHQKVKKSGISVETMNLFRGISIKLMICNLGVNEYEDCGQALASKLLRWSLESNGIWDEFLEMMKPDFSFSRPRLLDVLRDQPPQLARKFVRLLEPSIRENRTLFLDTLLKKLDAGDDHRPYFVLAQVCGFFTELKWSMLMKVAIMSPFFDIEYSSSSRVSAASSLRFCIDHAADFHFSTAMIYKLLRIIYQLLRSREASEKHVGLELYEAFGRRVLFNRW